MSALAPIVWLDLEAGGTDPTRHQITQIAALATTGDPDLKIIGEPFEVKVELVPARFTKRPSRSRATTRGSGSAKPSM